MILISFSGGVEQFAWAFIRHLERTCFSWKFIDKTEGDMGLTGAFQTGGQALCTGHTSYAILQLTHFCWIYFGLVGEIVALYTSLRYSTV